MQSNQSNDCGEDEIPECAGMVAVAPGRIEGMLESHPVRLNIGAGKKRHDGWISIDCDGDADVTCDIRSIPLPDSCADDLMAIHVIEHFFIWEVPAILAEWKRLLKPGGKIVLELPDLMKCCRAFVNGAPHQEGRQGIFGDHSLRNPLMMHKWGWLPKELASVMKQAGFVEVTECSPQFHGKRKNRDMRIEAKKP